MDKTFTKNLLFFILFILFASTKTYSQTITIGTVDSGPYGQGSSIAVPITINDATGCILQGNVYNLYLSDASGSFASGGTLIGSYAGHYTPFINGLIPTTTPAGSGYTVMVKSTTPAISSSTSTAFTINAVAGVKPSVSSLSINGANPEVFGICNPRSTQSYVITNTSAANTKTTISLINQLNQTAEQLNIPLTNPGDAYTFKPAGFNNYALTVKTVNQDNTIGTYDYQVVNNQSVTNFGAAGSTTVCLDGGKGSLSFHINIPAETAGVGLNYPGDTYLLDWGDGTTTSYTFCELKAANGFVSHVFTLPSCKTNTFFVQSQTVGQYCGTTPTKNGVSAKVLIAAITDFTFPTVACTNKAVTLNNTSQPGPDPDGTTPTCDNNPATLYDWTVGTDVYSGYTLNQTLTLPAGKYHGSVTVSLHQRDNVCGQADNSHVICFENPPQPSFTITPTTVCASATSPLTPVNTSTTDAVAACSVAQYIWTVTGPAAVGYANGTSASSQTPQFLFTTAGTYQVAMSIISGGCGTIPATPVTVTVDALPTAGMSANVTICRTGQTLKFDPTQTLTKTTLTGTTLQTPTTYQWSVSGGAFTFADGTNANSQYPHINFTQDVAYTVSAVHTNSCGIAPASQIITFQEPPAVIAGTYLPICYNSSVTLNGQVGANNTGYQWTGGAGTFLPNRTTLNATYTPTSAEVTAGSVVLTLQATTSLSTCALITNPTTITITPVDKITSATTKSICSAQAVAYTITADHLPSAYKWSAAILVGTPTGFSASGTTNIISDVLTNTSNTDAVVRYTITPTYMGCDGLSVNLDVTVHPLPVIVAPLPPVICNNQAANIQFVSSIATGTTYTWTSAAVAGISGNNPQATQTAATNGIQDVLFNSTTTPQTVVYKVTPYNNGCPGATVPYSVIVGPNIKAYAGPPIQLCGLTSTPLNATAPIIGSGYWTQILGPTDAHVNDPTDPKTTVVNLTPGKTYTFQWAVTVGSCPALNSSVTVEDDLPTVAGTANTNDPKVVCYNTGSGTIFLSPDVVGNVLYWESSVDGGPYTKITPVNTSLSITFGPLTNTTSYRAVVQNGLMCDILPSNPVTITVLQPPVTADAGLPKSICGNGTTTDSYQLQGNNPAPGYGRWTIPLGSPNANFDDPTDPHTFVRGLVAGTVYNFTWTTYGYTSDMSSPSPCQTNSNTVTITDDLPAAAGQTSTLTPIVCSGISGGTIILQSKTGNVVYWESSTDGNNFTRIADPNTSDSYQFPPLTAGPIWYRAEVQNGLACPLVPSVATKITVVQPPVTADAGPDMPVCITPTIDFYQLQGNSPAPGYGKWTVPIGSPAANFDNLSDPNTTVRGLVANTTYLFTWTTYGYTPDGSISPCGTSFKTVKITAEKQAKGGSASTLTPIVCSVGNTGNIALSGEEGNVLYWEYSINGTVFNRVPEVNTTTSYTFNNITVPTWYRAEVQNGLSCPTVPSDAVEVTVGDPPVHSNAGQDVPLCNATSYKLQANDPSPGTGMWSTPPGFPTALFSDMHDPNATVTLTPGSTYNLTWTTYGNAPAGFTSPCAPDPSTVIITDNLGVTAGTLTANPSIVCKGGPGGNITLMGNAVGTITGWASSTDNGTTWVPIANTDASYTFLSLTRNTIYRVYLSNGNCNTTSDVLVTAVDPPVTANAGTSGPICNATTYQLQANSPGSGTGTWTIPAGSPNVPFDDMHDPYTTVRNLNPGTIYNFTWTIYGATPDGSASPCDPSPNTVTINDVKLPVGTTSGDAIVCAGINGSLLTVTGQFDTNLGWEYSDDLGTTWTPTGNTTNSQPYSGLTRTRQFRVHLRNDAGCDAYSSITTISVGQPAAPAIAGTSQPICNATQYTLQGSDPGTGTGLWTVAAGSDPAFIQNPTSPNAIATGLTAGKTYQFTWTTYGSNPDGSVSFCIPNSNTITITDEKPPVAGDITAPVTICKGNSGGVQLSNYSGTVRWKTSIDNGITWVDAGGGDSKFYPSITQTIQYMAIVSNGSCGDASPLTTTIFVAEPAVIADAGPQAPVCNQTTYNLQGNDPGRGTGLWTLADGSDPATIHNATSPNATVDGMTAGHTYKFTWTITGYSPMGPNPCPANSKTITIVDDNAPVAGDISPSVTVCRGKSDFVTLTNYSGSIKWMQSANNGATWTATGYTTDKQPYIGITNTTQYMAIVSNGSCADAQSAVSIIYVAEPAVIANAGTSGSVCNKTTLDLQGNDPGTGTGLWTVAAGSASANIQNPTSRNATAIGLTAGNTYMFTWTITGYSPTGDHPCEPSGNTITIVDDLPPTLGGISADATVCNGANDGDVTLTNPFGSIQWMQSVNNGTTWTLTGSTGDTQHYHNLTSTIQYQALISNGSCSVLPSPIVTITVAYPPVLANAGLSGSVCNKITLDLHGNDPGTGTGLWTVAAGSASANIQNPTNPNATAIGLTAGNTYMFTWTITGYSPTSDHPCGPSSNTITIVDDLPAIAGDITPSKAICSGSSGTLELTNSFGSIKWLKSVDNGTTWTAAGSTSANQDYIGITQPTQYKAIVSNGSCSAESNICTITIAPPAIASYPGPDEEVCGESTHTLQATLPAGSTGKWTILSGAGAHFTDDTNPTTVVTGLVAGTTYKFIWTVSGTSPCDPIPGTVTIINDIPATGGITTAVPATVCSGGSSQVTLSQNQNGIILRWESSTDGNWQPLNITGQVQQFSNLLVPTQYRAILKGQGVCGEVPSASVTVTVNPPTVIANAGGNDEVCSVTSYPLNGNSPGAGTGKWTPTGGPTDAHIVDDTDPKTLVTNLKAGYTYQFTWTITGQAPCGQNSNSVNITIDLQPVGGTTTGAITVCADDKDAKTITLKDWVGNITWQSSPDGINNWANIQDAPAIPSYSYSGLTKTTYFRVMLTEPGKCSTAYSSVTEITVNPATVIADAGQDFNICNQTFAKLNGNNPSPSTGIWTQTAGPTVNIANPTSYQAVATGLAKGNVYTFKWSILGLAPCANTDASVTIGAYEDVIPSFIKTAEHGCGPVNVTFTNTSTPSPVGTFEWNFGDGTPIVTATNPPTHSFAPSTDGTEKTYTVTLTPTSNCGSKAPFTDYVKVSPVTAVASLLPGQTSYCGAFTLTAKNMSPGNNAQYDFYLKDAKGNQVQHLRYNDTEDAIFQTITPTVATYYTVSITATDQCGNQASSTPVNISVAPSNIVSGVQIKGDLGTICLGSPITFQNISTGGDRFAITIFDVNQKPLVVLPSGVGDLNYTPAAIGTYYVSMVAGNNGCGDAAPSELKQFVVAPIPKPVFTYSTDNNYNISFYNNTRDAGTQPASTLTYNWDFGDGSKNETAYLPNTHHFDASKSPFTVTLTATTPGTNCFNITQQTITLTFHGDLYFPNAFIPTSSNRELNTYRVKGFGMKTWHMQIFNNFGQLVWETTKLDGNGSPVDGWDGTYRGQIVQQGVYIWQISATLLNGEEWKGMSSNGSTPTKTGPIHLIR
jgi:hypothetical protein